MEERRGLLDRNCNTVLGLVPESAREREGEGGAWKREGGCWIGIETPSWDWCIRGTRLAIPGPGACGAGFWAFLGTREPSGVHFGVSWGGLGCSWELLGGVLGALGSSWGGLGDVLGGLGAILARHL